MSTAGSHSDALDLLYAAPLDGFVALRKELAAARRAAGDPAGSREIAAAKKPSRIAWALNQVARQHPELLKGAFASHAGAARAQAHGDAEAVRDAVRWFREALAEVVREGSRVAAEAGVPLSADQARGLGETVRAAITGGTQAELLAGRSTEDAEVEDPFAGLAASPAKAVGGERSEGRERAGARTRVDRRPRQSSRGRGPERTGARGPACARSPRARDGGGQGAPRSPGAGGA
jgi:hypothetical protein